MAGHPSNRMTRITRARADAQIPRKVYLEPFVDFKRFVFSLLFCKLSALLWKSIKKTFALRKGQNGGYELRFVVVLASKVGPVSAGSDAIGIKLAFAA